MAQARPNAVQIGRVLLTVADSNEPVAVAVTTSEFASTREQKRASYDSQFSSTSDHELQLQLQHNMPRMSAPSGVIKSAMKHRGRDLRTPSPAPHDDLQSPFEDADYIRRFLNTANRHSVRFCEDCPHENNIDVRLEDKETISVHVGYLQLECVYTVEFAIPADLLYEARGGKPADAPNVAQFLHGWRVDRVLGKQAKLIRSSVNEEVGALHFEFEFRAMKEKIVAQRFIIAFGPEQAHADNAEAEAEGDAAFKLNVVLVGRVFPRVKGTALLRDGVHMISNSHARRTSCTHDATETCAASCGAAAECTAQPDNVKPNADQD